ncbi:MAG: hypothetical protein RMM58_02205 [Chloroflexota bacterium]|nr:hypothetical protein [Dehalococcoidia bacterium]MDW8252671.1 hypothetical protein [Chloroflexota bacterium]
MRLLLWVVRAASMLALFALAVWLVATGGQLFFYLPGLAAKSAAHALTGASSGPVATLFFLLFAALYLGLVGGILFGMTLPFRRRGRP